MKFTADELFEMAKEVYREYGLLPDGTKFFDWCQGIGEWADESSRQEYENREEVLEELRGYLEDAKEMENQGIDYAY